MSFSLALPFQAVSVVSALAVTLVMSTAAPAQTLVSYGEHRSGTITTAGQTHRYFLQGAQAGDTLRITFRSQYTGGSCRCYHHRLDVADGTTPVGSGIDGAGTLTVTLSSTALYTITVRARNNQYIGGYAFQVNRLNDPIGADRIAHDWSMNGSIGSWAEFQVYTLRGEAGSSAELRFTSQYTGGSCRCYHHYAELVDSTGARVAEVSGNGASPFTYQATGVYTLFVRAAEYSRTGWYTASVACQSTPGTPCDTQAHASNFCEGWPGTNGVPTLTASALPRLGSTAVIDVGNSAGGQTLALVLIGLDAANQATTFGGTLCVGLPMVLPALSLPPQGASMSIPIPNHPLLMGWGFALQSLIADPGAQGSQVAFSRGLLLLLGR